MTEQVTANICLGVVCCGWPALWAFAAFNIGRYGVGGWWRQIVIRLKQWGGNAQ